mgnify:CR=1 FL=1
MITIAEIQNRIIKSIKESGMTYTEIANKLNISRSSISHFVRGDILPALDTLANLCQILDLDTDYILCQDIQDSKN